MGGVLSRTKALQGPVHAGGTYAQAHRRETTQVHGEKLHYFAYAAGKMFL